VRRSVPLAQKVLRRDGAWLIMLALLACVCAKDETLGLEATQYWRRARHTLFTCSTQRALSGSTSRRICPQAIRLGALAMVL